MLILHDILFQNYFLKKDIDIIYLDLLESLLKFKIDEEIIKSENFDDDE